MSRSYATTRYASSSNVTNGTWYQDEIPSGAKPGTSFTLAHGSITELFLELNGQYQISGIDYTRTGTSITMTSTVLSTDILTANYLTSSTNTWYQDEIVASGTTGTTFNLLHIPQRVLFLYLNGQYLVDTTIITMTSTILGTDSLSATYLSENIWYQDQVPSGTVPGTVFRLANSASVLFLYLNGQYQASAVDYILGGVDYTRSGLSLTLNSPLISTDILTANYS